MAEIIGHGQALDAPPVGQAVADEVHAPHLVDLPCDVEGCALHHRPLGLLALAHRQLGDAVEPVHAFVIHIGKLRAQQVMDPPIAESPPDLSNINDCGAQRRSLLVRHRWVAVTVAQ